MRLSSKQNDRAVGVLGSSSPGPLTVLACQGPRLVVLLLVPAAMSLMGRATWWMPAWLDRLVPQFHVEGPEPPHDVPLLPYQRPDSEEQAVRQKTTHCPVHRRPRRAPAAPVPPAAGCWCCGGRGCPGRTPA